MISVLLNTFFKISESASIYNVLFSFHDNSGDIDSVIIMTFIVLETKIQNKLFEVSHSKSVAKPSRNWDLFLKNTF